jgi:putative SOS response-associated peptidase YedK
MPAILEEGDIDAWLGGTPDEAQSVLKPYGDEPMREHRVSRSLNSPDAEPDGLPAPSPEEIAAASRQAKDEPPRQQSLGFD